MDINECQPQNIVVELLRNSGSIISLVIAISFLISIVYDTGYFFVVGVSTASIQTSIYDHLRSSLIWFPIASGAAILYILVIFFYKKGRDIEKMATEGKRTNKFYSYIKYNKKSFFALLLSICLYILLGNEVIFIIGVMLSLVWVSILDYGTLYYVTENEIPFILFVIFLTVPSILFMFLGFGSQSAYDALACNATVSISGNNKYEYNMLRVFEKGLLLYNQKEKSIQFIDNSGNVVYSLKKEYKFYIGVLGNYKKNH